MNLYGFAGGDPVNFSDPFGLCPPDDDKPCPGETIKKAAQNAVDDFTSFYTKALDAVTDAIDFVIPVKSAATAAGLNPNANDAGSRTGGAVNVALAVAGPVGDAGRPALRLLHDENTLFRSGLDYFRKQSTEDIVRSLGTDAAEPLIVNARGTVMNGNHRIFILMERGFDVNSLPRVPHP